MLSFGHRAAPGNQEYLMTLLNRVLDQRVFFSEIKQVIFVDTWWYEQQWRLFDFTSLRRILDQLDQFILENHGSRGCGQVAADLEGRLVDAGDAPLFEVINQIFHAVRQTRGAGFDRLTNHFGISCGEIRRAHCVDKLTCIEPKLKFGSIVDLRHIHKLMQMPRAEQICLLEKVVIRLLSPRRVLESPIAFGKRNIRMCAAQICFKKDCVPKEPHLLKVFALEIDNQFEGEAQMSQ